MCGVFRIGSSPGPKSTNADSRQCCYTLQDLSREDELADRGQLSENSVAKRRAVKWLASGLSVYLAGRVTQPWRLLSDARREALGARSKAWAQCPRCWSPLPCQQAQPDDGSVEAVQEVYWEEQSGRGKNGKERSHTCLYHPQTAFRLACGGHASVKMPHPRPK
jgi:hypothetical protein